MASSNPNWFRKIKENLTNRGREIPDPTPMAPPVGFRPAPSLADQIREMVRSERLAREVMEAGYETFEEADDFDIPDDPLDPHTPYEAFFDSSSVGEMKTAKSKAEAEAKEKEKASPASAPPQPPAQPATEPRSGDTKPPSAPPKGV